MCTKPIEQAVCQFQRETVLLTQICLSTVLGWVLVRFCLAHLALRTDHFGRDAVEEHRPPLLQERQECLRVRNDGFQRPILEPAVLMLAIAGSHPFGAARGRPNRLSCRFVAKHLDKALIEDGRNSLSAVMTAQQDPEQVRWLLDEFRHDLEHMTKDELLRSVVAELPRRACLCVARRQVLRLRIEQGVEISPVERRDHGIAEIREEIAQAKMQPSPCLQEVIWLIVQTLRPRVQDNDHVWRRLQCVVRSAWCVNIFVLSHFAPRTSHFSGSTRTRSRGVISGKIWALRSSCSWKRSSSCSRRLRRWLRTWGGPMRSMALRRAEKALALASLARISVPGRALGQVCLNQGAKQLVVRAVVNLQVHQLVHDDSAAHICGLGS